MSKYKSAHIINTIYLGGDTKMYMVALLETEDFSPYKDIGGDFVGAMCQSIQGALDYAAKHNVPLYDKGKEVVSNGQWFQRKEVKK